MRRTRSVRLAARHWRVGSSRGGRAGRTAAGAAGRTRRADTKAARGRGAPLLSGYSDREMARVLGCPSGTARQRVHAGLGALERIIRERYGWLLTETPSGNAAKGEARHA